MSEARIASSEKKVMIEFLKIYKESPSLWDSSYGLYLDKDKRKKAYQLLLEKYRSIHPDANISMVKKKIECMRSCYRRERRKVINDYLKYGKRRKPLLWYYDHLTFLDKVLGGLGTTNIVIKTEEEDQEEEQDGKSIEEVSQSGNSLMEESHHEDVYTSYVMDNSSNRKSSTNSDVNILTNSDPALTEGEAFGRSIGLQLNEMEQSQRYIAEKLISEVIYNGRFEKLNITTRLHNVN